MSRGNLKVGDLVNNYTLIERLGKLESKITWKVKCKCGQVSIKKNSNIIRTTSCGAECPLKECNK